MNTLGIIPDSFSCSISWNASANNIGDSTATLSIVENLKSKYP